MENIIDSKLDSISIELNNNGINQLIELRKWTNFIAIAGFSLTGLGVLSLLVMAGIGYKGTSVSPILSLLPLLLICTIYFFPLYFLLQFSKFSKQAVNNHSAESLSSAFKYLKMHYRFMGILLLIILGIYLIMGLTLLASGRLFNMF